MVWYGPWGWGPWMIVPLVMGVGMVAMMLMMRSGVRGPMGWCGGWRRDEGRPDPALDTLRQRFASGELTPQEYAERRRVLLIADGTRGDDRQPTHAIGV